MTDTPSLRRSFRLVCNPGQIPSVEALLSAQGFVFEPEPFSPLARRLLQEPFPLGRSLAAFWGYVYIQDRSSMLPPLALAPGEGARVLDMCASPGSKTGLLAQLVGREGLVLGNEPARPRLANLRRNLAALNLLQAVTCSWPGESLPLPDASWDAVLLDPPCSGWGTTDKNPQAIKRWQGDRLKPMLDLQRKLLTEASRLLRPGGKLVYSTCTTNVDENEGQVRFAVEGLGLEPIPLEPFPSFVFAAPELPGCEGTLRVDEGASNAQGFYIALLRKPGDSAAVPGLARGTAATAAYRAVPPAFLAEFGLSPALLPPGDLAVFEDSLHFLPAPALAHLPAAVRRQGMYPAIRIYKTGQLRQAPIHAYMDFPFCQKGKNQTLALNNITKTRQLENKLFLHGIKYPEILMWASVASVRFPLQMGHAIQRKCVIIHFFLI